MSTYYNVKLMVGVTLEDLITSSYKDTSITRYDQATGVPYEHKFKTTVVTFDSIDYVLSDGNESSVSSEDADEDYPKGPLQLAIEAKYPGLEFLFPNYSPEQGILGVLIGKDTQVGGNVYVTCDINLAGIQDAFAKFRKGAPALTPTLLALLITG